MKSSMMQVLRNVRTSSTCMAKKLFGSSTSYFGAGERAQGLQSLRYLRRGQSSISHVSTSVEFGIVLNLELRTTEDNLIGSDNGFTPTELINIS
jgi:hypothetical protein